MRILVVTALVLVAICLPGQAKAEDIAWTGAGGDHDWKNPANWDRGRVPGRDDNVTIPEGTPECRVPSTEQIEVHQLVNRGRVTSSGDLCFLPDWCENYGTISAAGKVFVMSFRQNVNYGAITGRSVMLTGDEMGNAAGAVISTISSEGYQLIRLVGVNDVVNLGQIVGADAAQNGDNILIECQNGTVTNEGTIRAGNGLSGGHGGTVSVYCDGIYLNKGVMEGGKGDGDGCGGRVKVETKAVENSNTIKAGDSQDGQGGSVTFAAGDFTNSAEVYPGRGPLCVGSLIVVCPTGKISVTGSMGQSRRRDDSVAGYVQLVGDTVELVLDSTDYVNAERLDVTARSIKVSTHGLSARIWAEYDNRFNLLAGDGLLDVSGVDTGGVTAAGRNFLFADSIIPPQIGYNLAFSPAPMISGPDTSMVKATVTRLWAADTAGASDTLTACITNTGTATRVVNYDLASPRGWLVPLSGATALLSPLMSESVKTTFTIPDTAVTGSRDIPTAVLTVPPHFWDSCFGVIYCYSGEPLVGIEEKTNNERGTMNVGATIVRGVLALGAVDSSQNTAYRAEPSDGGRCGQLLDATGRKVLSLKQGRNDVSRLAPGVYFVVTPSPFSSPPEGERVGMRGPSAVNRNPSTVNKIVVTE